MKIVCSPKGIVDKDRPRQGIMDIADAGFLDQGVICGLCEDETDVWGDAACEYRIVEPIVEDVEKDALWTVNREYYLSLLDEARLRNVKILLKNMCRNVNWETWHRPWPALNIPRNKSMRRTNSVSSFV